MSVNIYPTQSGTLRRFPARLVRRPCSACARGPESCQPGWCDNGIETEHEPSAPEMNLADVNARAILLAVGLDPGTYDISGAIAADEVKLVIVECERAMVSDVDGLLARSVMLRGESRSGNFVDCGSSDESALGRLSRLLVVLRWAADNGAGIAWQ